MTYTEQQVKEIATQFADYIKYIPMELSDDEDTDYEESLFYSIEFDKWMDMTTSERGEAKKVE